MSGEARGRVRVQRGAKRIRAVFAGQVVVDSSSPLLVWEAPYYPTYYFPRADVRTDLLTGSGHTAHSPSRGEATLYTVRAGDRVAEDAVLEYPESPIEELRGHLRLEWSAMDAWFEEDEEVFVHPRDPGVRVDILHSSRRVRVEVAGVTVADSVRPRLLFETNLPTRYYLPKTDVRLELLEPSELVTHCPYKGSAQYLSVRAGGELHTDLAWTYPTPLPESEKVAGLVCFTDEKVDVYLDEVLQQRPKTKFA